MAVYPLANSVTAVQTIANVSTVDGVVSGNPIAILPANPAGSNSPAASVSFQIVVIGSGSVSATCQPVASNDGIHWTNLGSTIAATSASNVSSAIGSSSNAPFAYFGAFITAISGTNAKASVTMCA